MEKDLKSKSREALPWAQWNIYNMFNQKFFM